MDYSKDALEKLEQETKAALQEDLAKMKEFIVDKHQSAVSNGHQVSNCAAREVVCAWATGAGLAALKEQLEHGEYGIWVTNALQVDTSTARRYVQFSERAHVHDLHKHPTLRQWYIAVGITKVKVPLAKKGEENVRDGKDVTMARTVSPSPQRTTSLMTEVTDRLLSSPEVLGNLQSPATMSASVEGEAKIVQNGQGAELLHDLEKAVHMLDKAILFATKTRPISKWSIEQRTHLIESMAKITDFHTKLVEAGYRDRRLEPEDARLLWKDNGKALLLLAVL